MQDKHLREHLEKSRHKRTYLNFSGFVIRAIFYFAIWNVLSFLLSKWSKQTDRAGAPDNSQPLQGGQRTWPHPLRLYHFVRRHRLDHVARS